MITAPPQRSRVADLTARRAGLGALTFASVVVLQNLIRGGSAPANDAGSAEVLAHYADHRGITALLVATFVVSGTALAVFVGGVMRRLLAGTRPAWAYLGLLGTAGILILFSALVGTEEALSVVAAGSEPDLGAVQALWALHNSLFTVLLLSLGLAFLGLSRAGVAAGITPPAFERVAPVAFGLLATAAIAGPYTAAGEAMGFFGLGLLGFLSWLSFLVATGLRLVRSEGERGAARVTA